MMNIEEKIKALRNVPVSGVHGFNEKGIRALHSDEIEEILDIFLVKCPDCEGSGIGTFSPGKLMDFVSAICPTCKGTGYQEPLVLAKDQSLNLDGLPSLNRINCLKLSNLLGVSEGKVAQIYEQCQQDMLTERNG